MKKKILILEDEKILQNLLKKKLEQNGYEVTTADDGEEGLKLVEKVKPDLLLLDILMPKVNGFEVLEALRKDRNFSSLPVIIISNSGQPVEIKKAVSLGVIDYLVKVDFDPNEVMEKINKFFDSNKASTEEEEEEVKNKRYKNVKILLVEDDDFLRDICHVKLQKEGFTVCVAVDGNEACKKIAEEKPQVVLLDIILPGMDGFEVLQKARSNPANASVVIIMLTNLGQANEIEKGMSLGADDYIIKAHFTVGEIIEKVKELIKKKKVI